MKLIEHFILLKDYYSSIHKDEDLLVSKKDFTHVLDCTDRNINLILKKLTEGNYIIWNAGLGRGNLSTMRFLLSMEEAAAMYLDSLVKDEQYSHALEFIRTASLSKATNADLLLISVIFSDVEYSLYTFFKTEFGFLRPYLNAEQKAFIDHCLENAQQARDKESKRKYLYLIEEYLKENLFILFTYHVENEVAYHEVIEGLELNSYGWADFKNIWIDPLPSG